MPVLGAVLFDLDGTLLDIDMDRFMAPYVKRLGQAMGDRVVPKQFAEHLMAGVYAMITNDDPQKTNEEVFWEAFERLSGVRRDDIGSQVNRFYETEFPKLGYIANPVPVAPRVVQEAAARCDRIVLATNAIFPRSAIEARLRWAGVDADLFTLITTYENMHACKPSEAYYLEICSLIGVDPQDAIMVGNDFKMDIEPAARVGMATYYVQDVTPPGKTEDEFAATYAQVGGDQVLAQKLSDGSLHERGRLSDLTEFLDRLISRTR